MRYFSVISAPAIPNSRVEALKAAANKEIPHPRASFLSFRAGQTTPRLDHANTRMRPPQKIKSVATRDLNQKANANVSSL
jgi:hypothetical protein